MLQNVQTLYSLKHQYGYFIQLDGKNSMYTDCNIKEVLACSFTWMNVILISCGGQNASQSF